MKSKISNTLVIGLVASLLEIDGVQAGAHDLCTRGSDSECARFGEQMCCAHIVYSFKGDDQDFYACASRPGIEYADGKIWDTYGFSGYWYCDGAIALQTALLATVALAAATI